MSSGGGSASVEFLIRNCCELIDWEKKKKKKKEKIKVEMLRRNARRQKAKNELS